MIPQKLTIKNFFSHKESEIDFTEFDSALLIGNTEGDYTKSNGSGKSAIFESLLWVLFNKTRAANMDDLVRWGESTAEVILEFAHEKKFYKIIRSRFRVNSTTSVELKYMDSLNGWVDISGSTSGDTNKKIESLIKLDHKTFVNSAYFRQNDISEFAECEASRKKEILKSIVDISRWDEYEKVSRLKVKELNLKAKILQANLLEYEQNEELLKVERESLDAKNITLEKLKNDLALKTALQATLSTEYAKLKDTLDTKLYDSVNFEINSLEKEKKLIAFKLSKIESSIGSLKATLFNIDNEIIKIDKKISSLSSKYSKEELDSFILSDISSLIQQNAYFKAQYSAMKKELADLESHDICNADICSECSQEITKEYKTLYDEKRFAKISLLKSNIQIKSIDVENSSLYLSKAQDIDKTKKNIMELELSKDAFDNSKAGKLLELQNLQEEFSIVNNNIDEITEKLKDRIQTLESIKNNDFAEIKNRLDSAKADVAKLTSNISSLNNDIGRAEERLINLSLKKEQLLKNKKEADELNSKISIYEKLSKLLSKTGIQTVLLDSVIEDLERESNNILTSICNEPFSILLETQRAGSDGISTVETLDLKVKKDGVSQNFKSLSGGEKFRISLAIRIAMSEISSKYGGSCLEFLLLDEVNSPLDRHGIETLFVGIIKSLEKKYKTLIITHDESLKERFDNVINVTKINGESEVEFLQK